VKASAVVGHSSGEIAAAYAAGYISLEHAINAAYYRGYVIAHEHTGEPKGMMAAVGLSPVEVAPFLQPGVAIACENSPRSVTVSGACEVIERAISVV